MEYRPSPSVTTLRVFSMRTGLAASTVTPGKTAPDESFTTPAMVLCADATAGSSVSSARPIQKRANVNPRIVFSFVGTEELGFGSPDRSAGRCRTSWGRAGQDVN